MATCSCSRLQLLTTSSPTSQSSLISSPNRRISTSLLKAQPLPRLTLSSTPKPARWSVRCSAAGMGASAGGEESPYLVLGVSALEKFEVVKGTYNRKRKDAEKRGDEATVARLDKAYDKLMMMQLSNRKQGLATGGFSVPKEIRYADKRSWIPWGPKKAVCERRDVLINLAISALFSAWIVVVGGQADWKPLQFLIFGYIFRIFTKLGEFEPAPAPVFVSEEEEEEGGGSREDTSRRLRNGKRLLRTLGLVFSCVAFASLAYTGTLNGYEYAVQYVPRVLMGAQEIFVTAGTAIGLFIVASFYR
ncbi:hypothetical protein KC19_12G145900 [Ceratodon purpureus]|uniref:Chloroplast J-like domain 1 n=1 Tax=Ceratodon purpureus TaxID=3225 RepID=A0A8T0GAW7_CERPU|nr:hypothetical protein KC19_12G145900 [Ceratodon purpureus]